MTSDRRTGGDRRTRNDSDATFSFAVPELQRASIARELSLVDAPPNAANKKRGVDPYNTSGSFDRKNSWSRVGRR